MRTSAIAVLGVGALWLAAPGSASAQVRVEYILKVQEMEMESPGGFIVGQRLPVESAKVKATVETVHFQGKKRIARHSIPVTALAYAKVAGEDQLFVVCSGGQVVTLLEHHPDRIYTGKTIAENVSSYRLEPRGETLLLTAEGDEKIMLPVEINFMSGSIALSNITPLPPASEATAAAPTTPAPASAPTIPPEAGALALTVGSATRTRAAQKFAVADDATRALTYVTQPPDAGMEFALLEATIENRSDREQVLERAQLAAATSGGEPVFLWAGLGDGYAIRPKIVVGPRERQPLRLLAIVKPDVGGLSLRLAGGEAIEVELGTGASGPGDR